MKRFFSLIIENTSLSTPELSYYRVFVGVFCLFFFRGYSWLGDVPPGFFKPNVLTPAKFFDSLPSPLYFELSDVVYITLLVLVIFGVKTRISFLFLFLLSVINDSFVYSFGKIDHGIFGTFIFLLFFFSNSGVKYAIIPDEKWKNQKLSIAVFSIALVFAFFTAGYEKMIHWIDFDLSTSGIFSWFYSSYFDLGWDNFLADYFLYAPAWLAEVMDYIAVAFEISGIIFLCLSRKSWFIYLTIASGFHLVNTLILNIPFTSHVAVYGLWLLAPVFFKYKWTPLFFLLPFLLPGLLTDAALWVMVLLFSVIGWSRKLYIERSNRSLAFKKTPC